MHQRSARIALAALAAGAALAFPPTAAYACDGGHDGYGDKQTHTWTCEPRPKPSHTWAPKPTPTPSASVTRSAEPTPSMTTLPKTGPHAKTVVWVAASLLLAGAALLGILSALGVKRRRGSLG